MDIDAIYQKLAKVIPESKMFLNEPMSKHTSFKIGGKADIYIKNDNVEELKYILEIVKKDNIPLTIIGNGTNILVRDNGIRGIVISLKYNNIQIGITNEFGYMEVGSGVTLIRLALEALKNGLSGLEFACGIPGSLGGAIKINAGAYGGEIKDVLESTTYMDEEGNILVLKNEEHKFTYRRSVFNDKKWIIINARLKLEKGKYESIKEQMERCKLSRKSSQPQEPSAGSIFKRGEDYITPKLIDECGLKGCEIGGAKVPIKHAGFIINKGNAKASDVIELIDKIKKEVKKRYDKDINLEIEIIGE